MAFATSADIAARLGRDLGTNEVSPVSLLLDLATGSIASTCDKDDAWAAALNPVPSMLRLVCIEVVTRALANPQNLDSMQERLGAHEYRVRFRDMGLLLTEDEERRVRRAVYGSNAASARATDLANHIGLDYWSGNAGDIYVDEDVIAS